MSAQTGWTPGRVAAVIIGSIVGLVGLALLLAGIGVLVARFAVDREDGYYSTASKRLSTPTYALTVEDIDLPTGVTIPKDILGRIRIRAKSSDGKPVFVGIGPQDDVDGYLKGVGHSRVKDFTNGKPKYDVTKGHAPRGPPTSQRFWVAKTDGSGEQTTDWKVEGGRWSVVAMNADGSRGVAIDAKAGAKLGWLLPVGIGLLVAGLVILGGGVVLIVFAARRASRGA